MKSLYIANMRRLGKSVFYIIGLIIAFVATFIFTNETIGLGSHTSRMTAAGRTFFISVAIIAFFTIYSSLTICFEYTDGVFRNKLISGYSQKEIYFSGLFTQLSGVGIMWLVNILSGIIAGARPTAPKFISFIVMLIGFMSYATVIYSVSFRIRKPIISVIVSYLMINVCFNMILFGNYMLMITKGMAHKVVMILYNINVMGQWFTRADLYAESSNPGTIIQILLSLAVMITVIFLSTLKIDKRDII